MPDALDGHARAIATAVIDFWDDAKTLGFFISNETTQDRILMGHKESAKLTLALRDQIQEYRKTAQNTSEIAKLIKLLNEAALDMVTSLEHEVNQFCPTPENKEKLENAKSKRTKLVTELSLLVSLIRTNRDLEISRQKEEENRRLRENEANQKRIEEETRRKQMEEMRRRIRAEEEEKYRKKKEEEEEERRRRRQKEEEELRAKIQKATTIQPIEKPANSPRFSVNNQTPVVANSNNNSNVTVTKSNSSNNLSNNSGSTPPVYRTNSNEKSSSHSHTISPSNSSSAFIVTRTNSSDNSSSHNNDTKNLARSGSSGTKAYSPVRVPSNGNLNSGTNSVTITSALIQQASQNLEEEKKKMEEERQKKEEEEKKKEAERRILESQMEGGELFRLEQLMKDIERESFIENSKDEVEGNTQNIVNSKVNEKRLSPTPEAVSRLPLIMTPELLTKSAANNPPPSTTATVTPVTPAPVVTPVIVSTPAPVVASPSATTSLSRNPSFTRSPIISRTPSANPSPVPVRKDGLKLVLDEILSDIESEIKAEKIRNSITLSRTSSSNGFVNVSIAEMRTTLNYLLKSKEEAAGREDFEKAKQIKVQIEDIQSKLNEQLQLTEQKKKEIILHMEELEYMKEQCIQAEDYNTAQNYKARIDGLQTQLDKMNLILGL